MSDISQQIEDIRKEIQKTPYHKGTEHYIGLLRARIARLKDKLIDEQSKGKGGGVGYAVKKQGDATVVLVGPPSVGKSTLINKLTNTRSKIAPYSFTTVSVIPGMMYYKDARIQILDVPGLIKGAEEGKGRGKEVLSVIRGCELMIIITDIDNLDSIELIKNALERNGIRINKKKPKITIKKKVSGGITIYSNIQLPFSKETIKQAAMEFGIKNAEITVKEKMTLNELIDAFSKNRVYIPAIYVINKIDLKVIKINIDNIIKISAEKDIGLDFLKESIWSKLDLIRVYLVREDDKPSFNHPLVVKNSITLSEIANQLGENFTEKSKKALIWGNGAKFPGQEVSLSTKALDGMQIRFI